MRQELSVVLGTAQQMQESECCTAVLLCKFMLSQRNTERPSRNTS